MIAVRWIPVGGYQNLAQGHRQLGGIVVAKFIKNLVQQYGKKLFFDILMLSTHYILSKL